jgi:hypothetical protein
VCCLCAALLRYLSKLSQAKDGKLATVATEAIKDGPGTWFPCAGTITPWDSHLGRYAVLTVGLLQVPVAHGLHCRMLIISSRAVMLGSTTCSLLLARVMCCCDTNNGSLVAADGPIAALHKHDFEQRAPCSC